MSREKHHNKRAKIPWESDWRDDEFWKGAVTPAVLPSPSGEFPEEEPDEVDEAGMESFPCSDAPGYYSQHA